MAFKVRSKKLCLFLLQTNVCLPKVLIPLGLSLFGFILLLELFAAFFSHNSVFFFCAVSSLISIVFFSDVSSDGLHCAWLHD